MLLALVSLALAGCGSNDRALVLAEPVAAWGFDPALRDGVLGAISR